MICRLVQTSHRFHLSFGCFTPPALRRGCSSQRLLLRCFHSAFVVFRTGFSAGPLVRKQWLCWALCFIGLPFLFSLFCAEFPAKCDFACSQKVCQNFLQNYFCLALKSNDEVRHRVRDSPSSLARKILGLKSCPSCDECDA